MNHQGSPGARLARSQVTRHAFLGLTAGAVSELAVPALADGARASSAGAGGGVVGEAAIVGLGESPHGTHTLKHRVARYLVEEFGFRTIAWEEGWAAGVAIDRYVTSGHGDPTAVVGDALFMLRIEAMLDLVGWLREFNRGRPEPRVYDVPPPDVSLVDHLHQ